MTARDVNEFYDGSTVLEPLSKATDLPIDQVTRTLSISVTFSKLNLLLA